MLLTANNSEGSEGCWNCTYSSAKGPLPTDDLIVGLIYIFLPVFGGSVYIFILGLVITDKDMKTGCYKLMIHLGISDLIQLLFQIVSGIMQLAQSTGPMWFNMTCGGLSYTGWFQYTMFGNVLALNRFVVMAFPNYADWMFGKWGTRFFIGLCWLYGVPWLIRYLMEPTLVYHLEIYLIYYDRKPSNDLLVECNKWQNFIQMCCIIMWYVLLLIKMKFMTRNVTSEAQQASASNREKLVLMQSMTICGVMSLIIIFYHDPLFYGLPNNKWTYFFVNMLWLVNSTINPFVYLAFNKGIQKRAKAILCGRKRGIAPSSGTGGLMRHPTGGTLQLKAVSGTNTSQVPSAAPAQA